MVIVLLLNFILAVNILANLIVMGVRILTRLVYHLGFSNNFFFFTFCGCMELYIQIVLKLVHCDAKSFFFVKFTNSLKLPKLRTSKSNIGFALDCDESLACSRMFTIFELGISKYQIKSVNESWHFNCFSPFLSMRSQGI